MLLSQEAHDSGTICLENEDHCNVLWNKGVGTNMATSSFACKVRLMETAYGACFGANEDKRRELTEGICWLADCLEEELIEKNIPTLSHALASIGDLRDMASELFKDPSKWSGTDRFSNECYRLMADTTDH